MSKLNYGKAVKLLKPLKVLSYGPTFSGKTYGSLVMANGFIQEKCKCTEDEAWGKILLVDTEEGRGSLYASIGGYNYYKVDPPFTTEKLDAIIEQINLDDDIECVIIDSLTHFWTKDGGLLEQKSILDSAGGNSYTNWDKIGIKLNKTISKLLTSSKDIFLTLRAKSDTALIQNDEGKFVPKTFGLKPEFRDGFTFECDIVFNIDKEDHSLLVEKAIPGMSTHYDKASIDLGKQLYQQMSSNAVSPIRTSEDVKNSLNAIIKKSNDYVKFVQLELNGRKTSDLTFEQLLELESKLIAKYKADQKK